MQSNRATTEGPSVRSINDARAVIGQRLGKNEPVSRSWTYKLIRRGDLATRTIGGRQYITEASINALVDGEAA